MKNIIKSFGLSLTVLSLVAVGAVNAFAATTYAVNAITETGALTINAAAGSALTLGSTATTGNIIIGGIQTSGGILIGNSSSSVVIAGTVMATGTSLTISGREIKSINNSMTALSGGAQAGTALTKDISVIGTVAAPGDSVQLPVASAGLDLTIINRTATSMNVFPQTGDGINGLSANAAYAVGGNIEATCIAIGSSGVGVWECQKSAGR